MEDLAGPTDLVPPAEGSALALAGLRVETGAALTVGDADADTLLYVSEGSGSFTLGGDRLALETRMAALVLAGEEAGIEASSALSLLRMSVGPEADRHAALGSRESIVRPADAGSDTATGARSFQVLFGPHNGSVRATLFAGSIPPGKAPWHYHLYDEIVWVPEGPGRLHLAEGEIDLAAGSAFRLRPRQVHILENAGDRELTIVGVISPAGSPSAAYLTPEVAATHAFPG